MGNVTTIAIDLAKRVFQVAGEDALGEEQWQKRLSSREAFTAFIQTLEPPLVVAMEVGLGAQAWARALQARGLTVRLLPAQRVAEHRSGAKNDRNDVRAILRANRDASIHPVPVKTVEQLTMQALHRVRGGWIRRKTALGNQMRGLLLEHAVAMAKGDAALGQALEHLDSVPLPARLRELVDELAGEWQGLIGRLAALDAELARLARSDPLARRLASTPGVGPITATAMVCKTLDPERFANARQFAAYFGLVPDQHSSGERVRLDHLSRRGDRYLRSLLINGAHAVLRTTRSDASDPDRKRLLRWLERHGRKGAAVRLANRNLRVMWTLVQRQCDYHRAHHLTRSISHRA